MPNHILPAADRPTTYKAVLRVSFGHKRSIHASLRLSSGGVLAIGGLVSSILLSTAILVDVATRHGPDRGPR